MVAFDVVPRRSSLDPCDIERHSLGVSHSVVFDVLTTTYCYSGIIIGRVIHEQPRGLTVGHVSRTQYFIQRGRSQESSDYFSSIGAAISPDAPDGADLASL